MINTKKIGNIGEAKVLAKFVELGIPVYLPFGDNEKSDLIADFDGKLNRIQVKTSSQISDGKCIFSLISSTIHRKNGSKHIYSDAEIDYFACYSMVRDKVYLFSVSSIKKRETITVRFELPKNNQIKNIIFEDDVLIENVLCVETLHGTPKN